MSKLQCCLCLLAITVSLVGCSGNSKMEPKNLLVKALTLPKLAGSSEYETTMDMLMRGIESTDQYRSALECAQVQGKGVSRCLVAMRVEISSSFGGNEFIPGIEGASDEMFVTKVVGVFERGGKVGYMSNLGEVGPLAEYTDMVEANAPPIDGWMCVTLCPRDYKDDHRRWTYLERWRAMSAIRGVLRGATDVSGSRVVVIPSTWAVADGADFFLVSVGNGDHVRTSIGINDSVDCETSKIALELWRRIWSAVDLKYAGDRDPDKGPAPGGGD